MNMEKGERGDGEHSIIQVAGDTSNSEASAATNGEGEEITPLLGQPHKPRMTIFSVSYPKRKPPTVRTHHYLSSFLFHNTPFNFVGHHYFRRRLLPPDDLTFLYLVNSRIGGRGLILKF